MSKKFLAKLLIFCMVFTMLPMSAFAATGEDVAVGDVTYRVALDTKAVTVEANASTQLNATVYQVTGDTESIINVSSDLVWTSSDETIATVSNGLVTGVKAGTANITASYKGASDYCQVTVTGEQEVGVAITLNGNGGKTAGAVEGTTVSSVIVNADKAGYLPTILPIFNRDGYEFVGWAKTAAATKADVDLTAKFTADTTIYAVWEQINEVTGVTINPATTKVNVGKDVILTADVKVVGNPKEQTVTWKSADDKIAKVDETGKVTGVAVGTTTITATVAEKTATATVEVVSAETKLFTVTFVNDGKTISSVQVEEKGLVAAPAVDAKKGYTFVGWFNGETQFDATKGITDNITYTAKWSEKMFTVTFDPANGGLIATQKVQEGKKADKIADPTKVGYKFVGWYANGALFDFASEINADIVLQAKWVPAYVTVTLNANLGVLEYNQAQISVQVPLGGTLTEEQFNTSATRDGYVFTGWVDKATNGNPVTLNTTFNVNTTIYAAWTEAPKDGTEVVATTDTKAEMTGTPANETEKAVMEAAAEAAKNFTEEIIAGYNLKKAVDTALAGKGYDEAKGVFEIGNQTVNVKKHLEDFAKLEAVADNAEPFFYVVPTTQITVKPSGKDLAETCLTFDVKPVAVVKIAVTGLNAEEVKNLTKENSVEVDTFDVTVPVGEPVTVKLPVGDVFMTKLQAAVNANKMPAILHHGIKNLITNQAIDRTNACVVFTNVNGFSEIAIDLGSDTRCSIGDIVYDNLTKAIAAIKDGDTVVVNIKENATVTINKEGTFQFVKGANTPENVKLTVNAGSGLNIYPTSATNNGFTTYTITRPQSEGSFGGGGGSTGNVSIASKVEGGKVTVTPTRPTRGQTVTINVTANEGYKLDTLVVTDNKGNNVELTKVSDNKYTFVMPAGKVTVTPTFVKTNATDETKDPAAVKRFSDVASGAWYAEYITYVTENALMNGYDDGRFGPNDQTTRAQIVTVLYRLEGEPATRSSNSFSDVSAGGQYYSSAVAWAAINNIVNGYEDGRFGPNDNVTREQIAAILYRYATYKGYDTENAGSIANFSDAAKVSSWANTAISWAVGEGLMNGDNGALRPQGNATRAEIAALLMRFAENIAK